MRIEDFLLCSGKYRKLLLKNFVIEAGIGAYEAERKRKQSVRFNIEVWVENLSSDDELSEVYNYEEIIAAVKDVISRGHIELQETLAAAVGNRLVEDSRVKAAKIKTEKLEILPEGASLGVEIFVEQDDQN